MFQKVKILTFIYIFLNGVGEEEQEEENQVKQEEELQDQEEKEEEEVREEEEDHHQSRTPQEIPGMEQKQIETP